MAINRIREMWELVSKTVVNPEVDKLLRATQLFEFVKNPETAYNYIDNILDSINKEKLKNETVVVDGGNEVTFEDLLSSLKDEVNNELLKIKKIKHYEKDNSTCDGNWYAVCMPVMNAQNRVLKKALATKYKKSLRRLDGLSMILRVALM